MSDLNERFTSIVEEVVGGYHGLPLLPVIAEHYQRVAEEAAGGAPSEELLDCIVRTAVSLELDEMEYSAIWAARIADVLRARREALPQNSIIDH